MTEGSWWREQACSNTDAFMSTNNMDKGLEVRGGEVKASTASAHWTAVQFFQVIKLRLWSIVYWQLGEKIKSYVSKHSVWCWKKKLINQGMVWWSRAVYWGNISTQGSFRHGSHIVCDHTPSGRKQIVQNFVWEFLSWNCLYFITNTNYLCHYYYSHTVQGKFAKL